MTREEFEEHSRGFLENCLATLSIKGDEYASESNPYTNFEQASKFLDCKPQQALLGFLTKHLVSIKDMCNSNIIYSNSLWTEKIKDSICYLLLLHGMICGGDGM